MQSQKGTRDKILQFGKQEFLNSGYSKASLRNIASAANMTTGAIYTHFKDKSQLFEAVTDSAYHKIHAVLENMISRYNQEDEEVVFNTKPSVKELEMLYELLYSDFDAFYILIAGSEGSTRAGFVHDIIEIETEYTCLYLEKLKKRYNSKVTISKEAVHILADSYINALLEPIRHKMDKNTAIADVALLGMFHNSGWESILKKIIKG